jgi:hypothetical protein
MRSNVGNLERLYAKYQFRYGSEDDVVLKLRKSLDATVDSELRYKRRNDHYASTRKRTGGRLPV